MKKAFKKQNKLKKVFWTLVIILILLLLIALNDLIKQIHFILQYIQHLNDQINSLQQQIVELEFEQSRIENVILHQHESIQQLQNEMNLESTYKYEENSVTSQESNLIHNESEVEIPSNSNTLPIVIITTLAAIGKTVMGLPKLVW